MKYSQLIGVIAALGLIGACFLPWTELIYSHTEYNGLYGKSEGVLTYESQWIPHTFLAGLSIIFFIVRNRGAKHVNIFIAFVNFCWAIKNFILFTLCKPGEYIECPQIREGLILLVLLSIIVFVMSFLYDHKNE